MTSVTLTGKPFGTAGSYNNSSNTIANAFDGNPNTFVDLPRSSTYIVGLDVGVPLVVASISYSPRPGFMSRMIGGRFMGANKSDQSDGVLLATVTQVVAGSVTMPISNTTAFRYMWLSAKAADYCVPHRNACNTRRRK